MIKTIIPHRIDGLTFLEICSKKQFINNVQDALDLFGELYGQYYDGIIIYEKNITPDFFDLQTRLAGEILQKFSNYRIRIVIVGDWSKYTSRSLEAFIGESNKGKLVHFASSLTEAVNRMKRQTEMLIQNKRIETERLILRAWQESDAAALYEYAQNPNIGLIAGFPPHTSVENSREIIKHVLSAPENYAVVLKETGEAVGCVGIMTEKSEMNAAQMTDNECEIGYWIGEPYWGKGLIPEAVTVLLRHAFEDLRQTAVWCGYYEGNEKSKRVQEKCGFAYHHTEHQKPVPLLHDFRTEHFTKLTCEQWQRQQRENRAGK